MAAAVFGLKNNIRMKSHWRKLAALLPPELEKRIYRSYFQSMYNEWEKREKKFPPPHLIKQQLLRRYATEKKISVLVETGTYLGDMVFAMQDQFEKIYSIELSHHFYEKAIQRFMKHKHVSILEGDSGEVLKSLVPILKTPALFWLDGHYSGGQTAKGKKECPIYEELKSIFNSPFDHVILIDDARLFIGQHDYPTVDELKQYVIQARPQSKIEFENDAIIITSN